jgi:hypothetical protein
MRSVEELSETIIDVLCDRKGFYDWWYGVEDEDQENILEKIQDVTNEWID